MKHHGISFWKLILAFLILIQFSCTKDRDSYIAGRILEYGSNKPLEGVKVELNIVTGISFADSVFTDAEGRFTIQFPEQIGGNRLYFSKDKYITREAQEGLLSGRVNNIGDKFLDPKGWINVHIINNTGLNHELLYNVSWGQPQPNFYFGDFFNFYQYVEVYANRENIIYWKNTLNGVSSNFIDSLYVPAFDTVEYTIKL